MLFTQPFVARLHTLPYLCWHQAVLSFDKLFHLLKQLWKLFIVSIVFLVVSSLFQVLAQYGPQGMLKYQHWFVASLITAHPVASSATTACFLALILLSWHAHKSPLAHKVRPRAAYLDALLRHYGTLTLPIKPAEEGLDLQVVFQPLKLIRDPRTAEDISSREQRRALLGEPTRDDSKKHSEDGEEHYNQSDRISPVVRVANSSEALQKSPQRRIIILGGPGTGKTTALMSLLVGAAKQAHAHLDKPLPIFLSLPDFARVDQPIQDYLGIILKEWGIDEAYAQTLWEAIENGEAFLCLDGLDEIASGALRTKQIDKINNWASQTGKPAGNTWVIGSRFTEYRGGQFKRGQFTEWELQPLDQTLRKELAQRLLPALYNNLPPEEKKGPASSPDDFLKTLENHLQAAAWGENPLLFSLAATVFVQEGVLPPSRVGLYQKVTEAVLATKEKDTTQRIMLQRVLEDVALEFYERKGRTFTRRDLVERLPEICQEQQEKWNTEQMLKRLLDSELLDVVAHDTYGFRHQTFYEYLTASALAHQLLNQKQIERDKAWERAWEKRTFSRWTEVLRLMVGILVRKPGTQGTQVAFQWISALVEQQKPGKGDPADLALALAIKSLGEIGEASATWKKVRGLELEEKITLIWANKVLEAPGHGIESRQDRLQALAEDIRYMSAQSIKIAIDLLLACQDHTDIWVRCASIETLGNLRLYTPTEPFIVALKDSWFAIRQAAVRALSNRKDRASINHVINALRDENSQVRVAAIEALADLGSDAPVKHLVYALNDKSELVRLAVIRALDSLERPVPLERLLAGLRDKRPAARIAAAWALGEFGEPVLVFKPLVAAMKDRNKEVRRAVVQALDSLREDACAEVFIMALSDKEYLVRGDAAEALGALGKQEYLELLIATLADKELYVREATIRALESIGGPTAVEALQTALDDAIPAVRSAAAHALGTLGVKVSLESLIAPLVEKWSGIKEAALQVLGALGEQAPVGELIVALHDDWPPLRKAAALALGALGKYAPIEPLIHALNDPAKEVRTGAAKALGMLGEYAPIEPLVTTLADKDKDVRAAAIQALEAIGERAPIDPFIKALGDPYGYVRSWAVSALGKRGQQAPLDKLVAALDDEDNLVHYSAIWALGMLEERTPIDSMIATLKHRDHEARSTALQVLTKLKKTIPLEPLIPCLADEYAEVREAAIELLAALDQQAIIELLADHIENETSRVRLAIARARATFSKQPVIDLLVDSLNDPDSEVRMAAADGLAEQAEQAPVEPLLAALGDWDDSVRWAAAEALGKMGKRVPAEPLLKALGDSDWNVRQAAIQALRQTHPDSLSTVAPEALAILHGEKPDKILGSLAQRFIAGTIGDMERVSPQLIQTLIDLLDWPYWQVREEAAEALGKIRRNIPNEGVQKLLKLWHDPESRAVREAADEALAQILSLESWIDEE